VFFQAREASNRFYAACAEIVEAEMLRFAERTGRRYAPFEYFGHPEAQRVVVLMGSAVETAVETAKRLVDEGERVGVVNVRLYRPFSAARLTSCLPESARAVAVLDRTKEPGSAGEPLFLDVVSAIREASEDRGAFRDTRVIGGRYGLGSKEFTPSMAKAVFDELAREGSKRRFTVGITDDVTHLSLPVESEFEIEAEDTVRAVFYGLGSDGTVGANKNSIKIIGEETGLFTQGYFVYDSRKAGAVTVSHLRFGPRPIRAPYLIRSAGFVACHQFDFLRRYDVLEIAAPGARFLLDAPHPPEELWDHLPTEVRAAIREKKLELYAIDAQRVAREAGLGIRTNTIMQTCFFALMEILPREMAVAKIKESIEKTYARRGRIVVERNFEVVDRALDHLHRVEVPEATEFVPPQPAPSEPAPDFFQRVTGVMLAGKGDRLPVSAFPVDGTWPVGTGRREKRSLAAEIPIWNPEICIQCNRCALVCPHAAIRAKVYDPRELDSAPESFLSKPYRGFEFKDRAYTVQVAPEDCTGCNLCVNVCPGRDKSNPSRRAIAMQPQPPLRERERENYRFFLDLPEVAREEVRRLDVRSTQLFEPLFEYSSACPGCGETPYIKLLTQLFGDRTLIANATGCSSIYGGNLPTTPYSANRQGRGPAWSNSLFEDNAEFGFGMRLAVNALEQRAVRLLHELASRLGDQLVMALLHPDTHSEGGIRAQRERVAELRAKLAGLSLPEAERLDEVADYLVRKSVWLLGGDGWAYDIGYGGLDHVLAQEEDVNVLVLDTEVYSNTGGQQSKATPLGAAAKFVMAGKSIPKKDLGMEAMSYGHVYVARIAFGADPNQATRAFIEADSYPGPSLIIAMSPCIAHGYDLRFNAEQQKLAAQSGAWLLYRFDPRRIEAGEPPLKLDSKEPTIPIEEYMLNETRFRMVERMHPGRFRSLANSAQKHAARRFWVYERMAEVSLPDGAVRERKLAERHGIAEIGVGGKR
jgi:pyruvate-ferredoxin/flavodoxin oxidoreductase